MSRKRPNPQRELDGEEDASFRLVGTVFADAVVEGRANASRTNPSRALRPWQQEAVDGAGRRRFHGAFTGGFSAGYHNTVGSKEGWAPAAFVSSRSQRAERKAARPEDFMDSEDVGEHAVAGKTIVTTADFAAAAAAAHTDTDAGAASALASAAVAGAAAKDAIASALQIVAPAESAGYRLLRTMGWRAGEGVGPQRSRARGTAAITAVKAAASAGAGTGREVGPQLPPGPASASAAAAAAAARASAGAEVDADGNVIVAVDVDDVDAGLADDDAPASGSAADRFDLFAPRNTALYAAAAKDDVYGIGFDPRSDASEMQISRELEAVNAAGGTGAEADAAGGKARARLGMGGGRGSAGAAPTKGFGLGALEEADAYDDVYATDSMANYDIELSTKRKRQSASAAVAAGTTAITFVRAARPPPPAPTFPPVVVPRDFDETHRFDVSGIAVVPSLSQRDSFRAHFAAMGVDAATAAPRDVAAATAAAIELSMGRAPSAPTAPSASVAAAPWLRVPGNAPAPAPGFVQFSADQRAAVLGERPVTSVRAAPTAPAAAGGTAALKRGSRWGEKATPLQAAAAAAQAAVPFPPPRLPNGEIAPPPTWQPATAPPAGGSGAKSQALSFLAGLQPAREPALQPPQPALLQGWQLEQAKRLSADLPAPPPRESTHSFFAMMDAGDRARISSLLSSNFVEAQTGALDTTSGKRSAGGSAAGPVDEQPAIARAVQNLESMYRAEPERTDKRARFLAYIRGETASGSGELTDYQRARERDEFKQLCARFSITVAAPDSASGGSSNAVAVDSGLVGAAAGAAEHAPGSVSAALAARDKRSKRDKKREARAAAEAQKFLDTEAAAAAAKPNFAEAARKEMFGALTREVSDWAPPPLLCKRLGLVDPYKDREAHRPLALGASKLSAAQVQHEHMMRTVQAANTARERERQQQQIEAFKRLQQRQQQQQPGAADAQQPGDAAAAAGAKAAPKYPQPATYGAAKAGGDVSAAADSNSSRALDGAAAVATAAGARNDDAATDASAPAGSAAAAAPPPTVKAKYVGAPNPLYAEENERDDPLPSVSAVPVDLFKAIFEDDEPAPPAAPTHTAAAPVATAAPNGAADGVAPAAVPLHAAQAAVASAIEVDVDAGLPALAAATAALPSASAGPSPASAFVPVPAILPTSMPPPVLPPVQLQAAPGERRPSRPGEGPKFMGDRSMGAVAAGVQAAAAATAAERVMKEQVLRAMAQQEAARRSAGQPPTPQQQFQQQRVSVSRKGAVPIAVGRGSDTAFAAASAEFMAAAGARGPAAPRPDRDREIDQYRAYEQYDAPALKPRTARSDAPITNEEAERRAALRRGDGDGDDRNRSRSRSRERGRDRRDRDRDRDRDGDRDRRRDRERDADRERRGDDWSERSGRGDNRARACDDRFRPSDGGGRRDSEREPRSPPSGRWEPAQPVRAVSSRSPAKHTAAAAETVPTAAVAISQAEALRRLRDEVTAKRPVAPPAGPAGQLASAAAEPVAVAPAPSPPPPPPPPPALPAPAAAAPSAAEAALAALSAARSGGTLSKSLVAGLMAKLSAAEGGRGGKKAKESKGKRDKKDKQKRKHKAKDKAKAKAKAKGSDSDTSDSSSADSDSDAAAAAKGRGTDKRKKQKDKRKA